MVVILPFDLQDLFSNKSLILYIDFVQLTISAYPNIELACFILLQLLILFYFVSFWPLFAPIILKMIFVLTQNPCQKKIALKHLYRPGRS